MYKFWGNTAYNLNVDKHLRSSILGFQQNFDTGLKYLSIISKISILPLESYRLSFKYELTRRKSHSLVPA